MPSLKPSTSKSPKPTLRHRPRVYLSPSSYLLFKRSQAEWMKKYFDGKSFSTIYTEYGSSIHKQLEEESPDEHTAATLLLVPMNGDREQEMTATFSGVPLLCRSDRVDYQLHHIHSYKTGLKPWTVREVDTDEQLTFEALIYFLKYQKIPSLSLTWIGTKKENGVMSLTGEVRTIATTRSQLHFVMLGASIVRVWEEIAVLTAKEWEKLT